MKLISVISAVLIFNFSIFAESSEEKNRKPWEINWQSIGLASSGWTRSMSISLENPDIMWVVADMAGGVYYTSNGGKSWNDVTGNIIRDTGYTSFGYVWQHPVNNTIFVAGFENNNFMYSKDMGKTWKAIDMKENFQFLAWMDFNPVNPDIVYLIESYGMVFASKDGGMNWKKVSNKPQEINVLQKDTTIRNYKQKAWWTKIKVVPSGNDCGYTLFKSIPYLGIFSSDDEGKTWRDCTANLPHRRINSIDYYYDDKTKMVSVYALLDGKLNEKGDGWEGGVYASSDYGITWIERNNGIFSVPGKYLPNSIPSFSAIETAKKYKGIVYILGEKLNGENAAILRSEDGGLNWINIVPEYENVNVGGKPRPLYTTCFANMLALSQSNPNIFYSSAVSPILRFTDYGRKARQIEYDVILEDPGSYRWLGISHVCNKQVLADPNKPEYIHTRNYDVGYNRVNIKTGIVDFRIVRTSDGRSLAQGNALLADPSNPGVLYMGASQASSWGKWANPEAGYICKSLDYGKTFVSTLTGNSGLPSGFIFDIKLDMTSPPEKRRLYTSVGGYGVYRSEDSGKTWHNIHGDLPTPSKKLMNSNVRRIYVDETGKVYVISYIGADIGNYGIEPSDCQIYYSRNNGSSWDKLLDGEKEFGSIVFDLITEPGNSSTIYISSYTGVFKSEDAGKTWQKILENSSDNIKKGSFPYRLAIHPQKTKQVWVAFWAAASFSDKWGVWVSSDAGKTWHSANNGLNSSTILDLSVDFNDPDILYVGTHGSGCFRGSFLPFVEIKPAVWRENDYSDIKKKLNDKFNMPKGAIAVFTNEHIAFDGKFSEEIWKKTPISTGFISHDYPKHYVKDQTWFWSCYDKDNLYIRVKCAQPGAEMLFREMASHSKVLPHDGAIWTREGIEIFIEAKSENIKLINQFICSWLNEKADVRYYGNLTLLQWNPVPDWESKAFIGKDEFQILIQIPLVLMNLNNPVKGEKLKLKICRNTQLSSWTPFGYASSLEDFGELVFK